MPLHRLGSQGPEVTRVQERLKALDLYDGALDGDFGPKTEAAVRRFQQARGLDVDGLVGTDTWEALFEEREADAAGAPVAAWTHVTVYGRGAQGAEVKRIQGRLKERGHYDKTVDGDYGPGTEDAVTRFQQAAGLTTDGAVDSTTWRALFPEQPEIPVPAATRKPLLARCLELTGTFETSSPPPDCYTFATGDFDGQGISYGVLQWNFGQGSLPPLLNRLEERSPGVIAEVFGARAGELQGILEESRSKQLTWARSIQNSSRHVKEPWRGLFRALGLREECQAVQQEFAQKLFDQALALARDYGLRSERAAALMFDIKVQNGSISNTVRGKILEDFERIPGSDPPAQQEEARLVAVANRRAEASNPRWVEDVRRRKRTIAEGAGTVHGLRFHLETQHGLRLKPTPELDPA